MIVCLLLEIGNVHFLFGQFVDEQHFYHYFSYKADIKQKELNSLKYPKTFQYFI